MIQLLYTLISIEMFIVLTLLFKTPFRKLVIMSLDRLKRGSRGPVIVTTVGSTILVMLLSSVYSIMEVQSRVSIEEGVGVNVTDQVLMSTHLLEASLMGFVLFLALMIDRLHNYIRELRLLRKAMEAAKSQNQASEERKAAEISALAEEIAMLKSKIKKLEPERETKVNESKAARSEADALKKQCEGLLLEYDRLLEDNQNLKNQLVSMKQKF
ncbi:hypothetical protein ACFE04_030062 [Oxalis oulophora]